MKKISSLDFFPHDPESLLTDQNRKLNTIKIIDFLLTETIQSIQACYYEKKLSTFDSHIGDTLCQIRAYKTLLIAKHTPLEFAKLNLRKFKILSDFVKEKIITFEKVIQTKKSRYNKILDKHEKLLTFLEQHGLIFDFPEDIFYLVLNKILSTFSERSSFGIPDKINYEELSKALNAGKTYAKKMSCHFQCLISEYSCDFIFNLINDLPKLLSLKNILPILKKTDNSKRSVLPCYDVTEILLSHMLKEECPLLIIAHRYADIYQDTVFLFFVPTPDHSTYELRQDLIDEYINKPSLIIRGHTIYMMNQFESHADFVKRFLEIGLYNVVLTNMAIHPQYSADEIKDMNNNPYRSFDLNKHREADLANSQFLAELWGCSIGNSSLFSIKHIFSDLLTNHVQHFVTKKDEGTHQFDTLTL